MDSCNSGSLQSSSGGDEEYDSRATFMMGGAVNPNPLPPLTPFFDPFLSNYPQNNHFIPHTKTISDSINNATDNNPFTTSSQSQPPPPTVAPPHTAARNPKKRTRASRRAPTTVLTTDTTNFRAMVQEFTGIPSPPFVSSPFGRRSLDLFASPLDAPSYLSRPFAQKLQSPFSPFLTGNNINVNNSNNNNTSSSAALQSSNVFSNIVDHQGFFLGNSANLQQATHQKSNLFGLGSKGGDDQVHGGPFGMSSSASDLHHHHQFAGLGDHLKNAAAAATAFEGGLANIISSTSTNGGASRNDKAFDYSSSSSGPLASSFNGEKGQESSGRDQRYGGDIDA